MRSLRVLPLLLKIGAALAGGSIGVRALPAQEGLVAFRQALLDASVDARVVVVATHPDDPYRGLCLLLRRQWGCDVTVLVATRGEGGQNAIGPELGAELGRIRTAEAVEAARQLDVKLRFLDLPDFGYSRTAAEALDRWRGHRPLERLEDELADLDPDLLITPHIPGEAHGQKRAVVHLLRRWVADRGDEGPRFFRGVADLPRSESPHVVWELDRPDPERGRTYREEAFLALKEHRTQKPHQPFEEAIKPRVELRAEKGPPQPFDGLSSLWDHEAKLAQWLDDLGEKTGVAELRRSLDALARPARGSGAGSDSVDRSITLLRILRSLRDRAPVESPALPRLQRRVEALERAVLAGAAIHLSWRGNAHFDGTRTKIELPLRTWNGSGRRIEVRVRGLVDGGTSPYRLRSAAGPVSPRQPARLDSAGRDPVDLPLFLERTRDPDSDETHATLELEVVIGAGTRISARLSRRVDWTPPLDMRVVPESRFLVPERGGRIRFSLAFRKPANSEIRAILMRAAPLGVALFPESKRDPRPIEVIFPRSTTRRTVPGWWPEDRPDLLLPIQLEVAPWARDATSAGLQSRLITFYLKSVPEHDPPPDVLCDVRIDPVRIRLPQGLRIGIVRGPDNTVEEALASLGGDLMTVRALDPDSLATAGLDDFHTVLIDSRALLRRGRDLKPQVQRLLAYAHRGGHLVVLYHKAQEFNVEDTGVRLAPYELHLGTERVTREDAAVEILIKNHPVVSRPNVLEPSDWDGWVHERGLYFPEHRAYSPRYEEVLAIQEPKMTELAAVEAPAKLLTFEIQRGALLAAKAGSGSFVYCALVIHRQLKVFHPGAARLLVNLVTPPSWPEGKMR